MGNKTHGFGTTVSWDGYTIGGVDAIGDVAITMDTVDVSQYDSADAFKEHIQGMLDAGALTISGNFDQADTNGQIKFVTDMNARSGAKNLVITFPTSTGASWTVPAIPTGFTTSQPRDNKIGFSLTVKPTGKPILAVTASTGLTTPFFVISESAVVTPALSGNTYTYVATVLTAITSVTVTPTASAGVITVNGNTVATGVESSAITLGAAGTITPITIVVKETAKSAKTYTIYLSRAAS